MQNTPTHTDERVCIYMIYATFLTGRTVKGQFKANGSLVYVA